MQSLKSDAYRCVAGRRERSRRREWRGGAVAAGKGWSRPVSAQRGRAPRLLSGRGGVPGEQALGRGHIFWQSRPQPPRQPKKGILLIEAITVLSRFLPCCQKNGHAPTPQPPANSPPVGVSCSKPAPRSRTIPTSAPQHKWLPFVRAMANLIVPSKIHRLWPR